MCRKVVCALGKVFVKAISWSLCQYDLLDEDHKLFLGPFERSLVPLVLRVACCFACHQAELGPLVFYHFCSFMTVVVPWSAFFITIC